MEPVSRRYDRRADPLLGLADGGVGEAYQAEDRLGTADVDLDPDRARLDADQGDGGDCGEHTINVWDGCDGLKGCAGTFAPARGGARPL